jgi:hypothetical protein
MTRLMPGNIGRDPGIGHHFCGLKGLFAGNREQIFVINQFADIHAMFIENLREKLRAIQYPAAIL